MLLAVAIIPKADLVDLVESITPLTVTIDEDRGRVVTFGRPEVELVPGKGVRLRGDAHITWDFVGVPIPVTVRSWQVVLVPHVTSDGTSHVLRCELELEELDVKLVPGFADEKIADAMRGAIERQGDRLAWDFARALSARLPLPEKVAPASTFEISPVGGDTSVSESELRLTLQFEARFERSARRASASAPDRASETQQPR